MEHPKPTVEEYAKKQTASLDNDPLSSSKFANQLKIHQFEVSNAPLLPRDGRQVRRYSGIGQYIHKFSGVPRPKFQTFNKCVNIERVRYT